MNQRKNTGSLYWEDEAPQPKHALLGEHFWRSVWKGVENNSPLSSGPATTRELAPEAPRDDDVRKQRAGFGRRP